jgi:tetratricopeptide (TPR) repeat protein
MPTETALRAVFGVEKRDFEKGYVEHLDRVVASLGLGSAKAATTFAAAERAYQLDPKNADLAADLAVHYLKREKNRRARELADEALAIDGAHPRAVYVLAKLERSIGNVARAVELVEAAVKARPNDELLDLLAAIRIEQDRFAEAAALYESARAKEPFKQKWVEGLVRMYLKLQDLERLIPMLEALARMDAENVTVRQKRAEIAFDRQDWATAARWAREAMYITIKPIELHEILGRSAKELGDRKTAIREYEVIYELRKKRLADGIALARVYAWAEEPAKAKALVLELRKSAPEDADVAGLAKEMGFE